MISPRSFLKEFLIPKFKFGVTSGIATVVDIGLYLLLVEYLGFAKVPSNIFSAFCGMIINFFLQRKFIFYLNRKLSVAFVMSLMFSIVGIGISTALIYLLSLNPFFNDHQYITKPLVTGIVFFYNFYTKRFVFEKRFSW
ncbi:MAG: GtrA family protein [Chitinophagales bacterium]|nr:GtrA family protein [Chitinophagales bacterium]